MKTLDPHQLTCEQVAPLDLDDWASVTATFLRVQPVELRQAWQATPSRDFRPAQARAAWAKHGLYVYAELADADIFNPETVFNKPAYTIGDVFEIFLRPVGQAAYFEFHITPLNQKFQLRIPSAETFATPRNPPGLDDAWLIHDWQIESRARVCAGEERWFVIAEIPFHRVVESGANGAGSEWLVSFSRYDYTRGQSQPVISSSSPHAVANFHRQSEWRSLRFV